jgi:hypothetical protein
MRVWLGFLVVAAAVAASCAEDDKVRFDDDDGPAGGGGSGASGASGGGGSGASGAAGAGGNGASGGGGSGPAEPACDAPLVAPSGGSCVTLTKDVECNPVTNEPCPEVCGNYGLGLFQCYTVTSMEPTCGSCDDSVCGGTTECLDDLGFDGVYQCARFCCDDGDCGSGVCVKDGIATPDADVGVCLTSG